MRLREIIRYEIGYRLRNKTTWVYAFFLALLGFFITNANAGGGGDTNANAPADIAAYAALFCGMFGMLVSAGLFSDAAVRDAEVEMDPLLYTTRLTTLEFLSGRYLATLAVNAVIALAIPLGLIVAFLMPYLPKDAFGPFQAAAYLQPLVLFIYPNLVLVSTIQFAIAIKTRRTLPVYLGTIAVFISYIVAANYWQHVTNPILSALTDPFGVNALQSMTRFWSRVEQETRLIGFPPMLLLNRAIWLSVAIGVLAVLHRAFRFEHEEVGGGRRRKGERPMLEMPAERQAPVAVPRVSGSFGSRTRRAQLRTVFRRAFGDVLGAPGLILTLVAGLGLTLLWGWNVGDTVFDSSVWPVTHLIAEVALTDRNTMIPWLVVIVVAGELVWKDRDVGTAEMADAAPLPEWTTVLGRYLVLAALLVLLETAFLIGGVLIQTLQGYYRLELGLYVRILFGLTLPSYLIMAALAMTLHVLVNQKYVGHIVTLAAMLSVMAIPELTGMRHHLLLYNTSPGWEYSDMNGFGPFIEPYVWFKLYWAAWAALVLIVGMLFWVRGRESRVRDRLTLARFRFAGPVARAAAVAAVLALGFGGFIFYNTNVLNAYQSRDEAALPRVEYERRYGRYVDAPQPTITGAKLRVEIYPDDPAVDLSGTYTLVNRTSAPIDSVHVQLYDRNVEPRSVLLDRRATKVIDDNEVMYWIYDLEQPLAPGDSLGLTFNVTYRPKGFRNDNIPTSVVKNGAYFDRRWMPVIGYQKDLELTDADGRSRFKLPSKIWLPHPSDTVATKHRNGLRDADLVRFETTVGTSAEQTAVATGVLRRSWTENPSTGSGQAGRRYFQYDTEIPMSFGATVFSGKYERREDRWKDITLEILYHPAHAYNVDRMVESMKASLEYYTTNFGPYRGRQLRIVEVPPYDVFGRAHASAVAFGEDVLIARQKERQFDPAFYGTAHEIAHQWWGGQIGGAPVQGIAMLSESLANYSAIMVTEKTAGMAAARKVYDFQMDRYLRMRGEYSTEDPLVTVQNRPFIYYGKGAVAMYTLREQIGEEAVNRALRRYVERFAAHEPPFPTSLDLIAELRAATPDSLKYLSTDLFETVTLWNVRTERAHVEPTGNGDYRVTMDVVATKTRADSAGTPKEIPMNDWVEIGVFAADSANKPGDTLYLQRHRIRDGKQTITVTVPRLPARAGIDPARKLMDRDKDDNVVSVEKP